MSKFEKMAEPGLIAGLEAADEGVKNISVWRWIVWDGELRCVVSEMPTGWSMTISHGSIGRNRKLKQRRFPTILEVAIARDELLPDIPVICTVPTLSETKEMVDATLELFEFPPRDPQAAKPTQERRASGLIVPVT